MPLPKSITSLLTAIVVAIPAAITTLALNKPKPPKEIDAIIELDENNEVIDEQEIKPIPKPPEKQQPNQRTPATGSVPLTKGGGDEQDSESSSSTDSSSTNQPEVQEETSPQDSPPEEKEDERTDEGENEEEPETEDNDEDEEDQDNDEDEEDQDNADEQVPGSEDSQKDVTIEEMKKSLLDTIQKIIQEGSDFNLQSSGLLKLYNIKTGLETLPELINSLKTKMDEEKNKSVSEKGGSQGAQPEGEQS